MFATATPATTGGLYRPVLTDKSKRAPGLVTFRVWLRSGRSRSRQTDKRAAPPG